MADRQDGGGRDREPMDPEREAARHRGDEQRRRAAGSPRGAFGEGGRFGARGERGYRGRDARDTPPGSVPGGSYGGGGGYQQGGYTQGNYDPRLDRERHWQGRDSTGRDPGAGRARYGEDYERGERDPRGDWRQGYGGYGVSERGGMHEDQVVERAPDYEGLSGGYGFGGMSDTGRGDEPWPYVEPWAVPGPFTGRGPEGYQRSGEIIREDVCERLTRHGRLDASGIRVSVERGEVVLEGTVDSRAAKRMAEDTAESVAGVRDVHNRLRIRGQDTDAGDDAGESRGRD